jgi:hypothetical protein
MDNSNLAPAHLAAIFIPVMLFGLILTVAMVIPYWFIFKKAGFSPWLSVLMFVPLANIIILYVLAFSEWKVVPVSPFSVTAHPPQAFPPQV